MGQNLQFSQNKANFWQIWGPYSCQFCMIRGNMHKCGARLYNQPSNYNTLEVMSKNVIFFQKMPIFEKLGPPSFQVYMVRTIICTNMGQDTKISPLTLILLKLWTKMPIFYRKKANFWKIGGPDSFQFCIIRKAIV